VCFPDQGYGLLVLHCRLFATNYFEPVNEGAITVSQFSVEKTPLGVVMPLFAAYAGASRLTISDGTDDDVAVVAALQSNNVLVTLSNRNSSTSFEQPVVVSTVSGLSCESSANLTTLTPTDLSYWSAFAAANSSVPVLVNSSSVHSCRTTVIVPAYGIVQLRLALVSS
jgi:hypothetical protein